MSIAKSILQMFTESNKPTEDDLKRYKSAATKMVDNVIDRAKNPEDINREELEDIFYDNMVKMKKGEL